MGTVFTSPPAEIVIPMTTSSLVTSFLKPEGSPALVNRATPYSPGGIVYSVDLTAPVVVLTTTGGELIDLDKFNPKYPITLKVSFSNIKGVSSRNGNAATGVGFKVKITGPFPTCTINRTDFSDFVSTLEISKWSNKTFRVEVSIVPNNLSAVSLNCTAGISI